MEKNLKIVSCDMNDAMKNDAILFVLQLAGQPSSGQIVNWRLS